MKASRVSPIQHMRAAELHSYPQRNSFIMLQNRVEWPVGRIRRWKVTGSATLASGTHVEVECYGNVGDNKNDETSVWTTYRGHRAYAFFPFAKPTPQSMLRLAIAFADRVAKELPKPPKPRKRRRS